MKKLPLLVLGSAVLVAVSSLVGCAAQQDPIGTAQEPMMVCAGAKTLQGVDVYHGDGVIDWAQVKASGRAFGFAKATEGTTYTDTEFSANWSGMKQAGVVRSAYHFFHANVDPKVAAAYFLSVMGTLQPGDLPPTLDLEVTDNESAATITANAITWLDTVAAATGTKPILYTGPSFVANTLGSPAGLEDHAQLWVANWGVTCPDVPAPFTTWSFWQQGATGSVPGIPGSSGGTDVDTFDGDLAALTALTVGGTSSSSSASSSGSASSSSGTPPPACQVGGVAGTCIDVSVCAAMPGYVSTPGLCPGPASEECCTPTGGSASSGGAGGGSQTSSGVGGGSLTSGGAGGGARGAGGSGGAAHGSGGTGAHGPLGSVGAASGCSTSPADRGAGSTAGAFLAALALALVARGRKQRGSAR